MRDDSGQPDTLCSPARWFMNVDVLDLDRALTELAAFDARKRQIAEQPFFGGLSLEETGRMLGLSEATVEREWQAARAWLFTRLTKRPTRDA